MIKVVIRLQNDMVMVFDADDEQVTEYQGQYKIVKARILREASPDTIFLHWFGLAAKPESVSKENW